MVRAKTFSAGEDRRAEARTRYFVRDEAERLGWDVEHPQRGGLFLDEQELTNYFGDLKAALGGERPDFTALGGERRPRLVIECKAEAKKLDKALDQAVSYADAINTVQGYDVRFAVGVAGTADSRIHTQTLYRLNGRWDVLISHGHALTQLPTPEEVAVALDRRDATTDVQLPDEREFFDAAINISNLLRKAKVEEWRRPVLIGAVILALYRGKLDTSADTVIGNVNTSVKAAVGQFGDVPAERRQLLVDRLQLGPEAVGVAEHMDTLVGQLERLNVRSIVRSGVDFLGKFYETFLRYGYDAKKLGVVFTPRHITHFCADLLRVKLGDRVYDPACGTGGFLVAAFDRMWADATTPAAREQAKNSLAGCETNVTVWSLAMLNMFFRGDGKSRIEKQSAFDSPEPEGAFDKVMLNPPFSQEGEPEIKFIDHALDSLKPGGTAAVVVKTAVAAKAGLAWWRKALVARHHVLGVISLPPDLFYPTAAPTVILLIRAHAPQADRGTFLGVVRNDGFEVSKNRRINRDGSQLDETLRLFHDYFDGQPVAGRAGFVGVVGRDRIVAGGEMCAEALLPAEPLDAAGYAKHRGAAFRQVALAVASFPDVADAVIDDYGALLKIGKRRPKNAKKLSAWFDVEAGGSVGRKNYVAGPTPYVSSGDSYNSIVGMVAAPESETYTMPTLTVTGFGQAALQPWEFCARGNGGSAVRILRPRCDMTTAELLWFVAQINAQRWRFNYSRMATVGRLKALAVEPPPAGLPDVVDVARRVRGFRRGLDRLASNEADATLFGELSARWRDDTAMESSARRMASHPAYLRIIGMGDRAIPYILADLEGQPDHWFIALNAITGVNPVPDDARGRLRAMADAWMKWGADNGHL